MMLRIQSSALSHVSGFARVMPAIADSGERDQSSASCPVQILTKAVVCQFRLVIAVRADQPIEHLPHRKWQIPGILIEDSANISEEVERPLLRVPGSQPTDALLADNALRHQSSPTAQRRRGFRLV